MNDVDQKILASANPVTNFQEIQNTIRERWEGEGYSFCASSKFWELHTGGDSYNEGIIGMLQSNLLYWSLFWQKTERGGHYYFDMSALDETLKQELLK